LKISLDVLFVFFTGLTTEIIPASEQ